MGSKIKFPFKFSLVLLILIALCVAGCDTTEPPIIPPPPPVQKDSIVISIADVTHRSVSVSLQSAVVSPQSKTVKLFRVFNSTNNLVAELPGVITDTTIIDDDNGLGLLLDATYNYYAVSIDSTGSVKDTSNIATARTLTPTTHNYTWTEYTIGEWQSALYDVWGTDENNVYAVGSLEINGTHYSVLHYNGFSWVPITDTVGGTSIYGFSSTDIWIIGGGVYHYNGTSWERKDGKRIGNQIIPLDTVLFNNSPYTSIWGTSSSNLYLGNQWGKIIHWDGQKAEVLIDFDIWITDIYGTTGTNIWLTAEGENEIVIARFNGITFERLNYYPPYRFPMNTVYSLNSKEIYVGGDGVFRKEENNWITEDVDKNKGAVYKIRGTNSNNIFAVGAYSVVHHFNGIDWKFYDELYTPAGGINQSVFNTGNKVFIVGRSIDFTQAKILIGEKL
ncbi:MAG: hypothetical protein MUO34_11865 [Ignavibacteriaceae bacterium]|nr:hypothetical protein [Ignavibacteriaceae bacterium]